MFNLKHVINEILYSNIPKDNYEKISTKAIDDLHYAILNGGSFINILDEYININEFPDLLLDLEDLRVSHW